MKRKTYMKIQSGSKFLLILILVVILLVGAAGVTFYAIHNTTSTTELQELQSMGLVDFVTLSNGKKMNVAVKGASQPKHTMITIAGMGYADYGVYMDNITQSLQQENRLVIVDRLGTGYSDDTDAERSVTAIVEEYRTALQLKSINAPYVLLAHEIGAVYATQWQALYPNEIEGIVYIDPNPIDNNYAGIKLNEYAQLLSLGAKVGVQRVLYDKLYTPESVRIPNNYALASRHFNFHSVYTTAYMNEVQNAVKNFATVMDAVQTTNIPKMYINSSYAFETTTEALEYVDYMNAQARSVGQEKVYPIAEVAADGLVTQSQSMSEKINAYVQKLGACHLVKMPGGPSVYEQHHGVVESAVVDFINYLDGNVASLKNRYVDKILDEWQQKQEQEQQTEVTEPLTETESQS